MNKVVFVCLGNICRSPMAEFIMKALDQDGSLHIESRATSSWEQWKSSSPRNSKDFKEIWGFF